MSTALERKDTSLKQNQPAPDNRQKTGADDVALLDEYVKAWSQLRWAGTDRQSVLRIQKYRSLRRSVLFWMGRNRDNLLD